VCKLYLLFISANVAQEKEKKEKKLLQPTGVSKSVAHAVFLLTAFSKSLPAYVKSNLITVHEIVLN
jgi:hypothetical protein